MAVAQIIAYASLSSRAVGLINQQTAIVVLAVFLPKPVKVCLHAAEGQSFWGIGRHKTGQTAGRVDNSVLCLHVAIL